MSKVGQTDGQTEHPNYTRLKQNEEETKASVSSYLGEHKEAPAEPTKDSAALLQDANSSLEQGNYARAIDSLQEKKDLDRGVVWQKSNPHADGSVDLIRDARNAKTPPNDNDKTAYAVQLLNAARAAEKLVDSECQDDTVKANAKKRIRQQAQDALKALESGKPIDIVKENAKLVKVLKTAGIEKPKKKLSVLKEFGNFEDQHYHVSTVTNQKDGQGATRAVVESDVMMLGLTDGQKAQYQAIAKAKNSKDEVTCPPHDMSWYNKAPKHVKEALKANAGKIAEGNHVLPTQLRKEVIGLRNAHVKTTYVQSADKESLKDVMRDMHMGTPSFHGKKLDDQQNQAVANDNIKQAQSFTKDGQVVINVLNSPANPTGIDSQIHKQVGAAAEASGGQVARATTPFNAWRRVSSNDNAGFQQALDGVAKVAHTYNLPQLTKFLETGKGAEEAAKELKDFKKRTTSDNKTPEPYIADLDGLFTKAFEAKQIMNRSDLPFRKENNNLELVSAIKLLAHEAKSEKVTTRLQSFKNLISEIITNCASGKDRTGIALTETTRKAVQAELGVKKGSERERENFQAQINGGHTQAMAGTNGGTKGADGVKKDSKGALPENELYGKTEGLILETASYNKFTVKRKLKEKLKIAKQSVKVRVQAMREKFTSAIPVNIKSTINAVTSKFHGNKQEPPSR